MKTAAVQPVSRFVFAEKKMPPVLFSFSLYCYEPWPELFAAGYNAGSVG